MYEMGVSPQAPLNARNHYLRAQMHTHTMLMVAPRGRTKEAMRSEMPSLMAHAMVVGRDDALEADAKAREMAGVNLA